MKMSYSYKGLRSYVSWMLKKTMYKSFISMGLENVPAPGAPVLVVENHQNGICDPLGLVVSLMDRKTWVFSRADIFNKSKWLSKFLNNIGLLPAYRMNHDGWENVSKNYESFGVAEQMLLQGETVAIYPEGKHQGKRILGEFSSAYLRMAFEAAKAGNYEKEIWVLPTCNHYNTYKGLQNEAMIRYGVPIALSQWYDQYKEKPRTTCNEVNKLVHSRVAEMMLNISNDEEYSDINFLCNTMNHYKHGKLQQCLPAMLEADKGLCNAITQMGSMQHEELINDTRQLIATEESMNLNDKAIERNETYGNLILKIIVGILLLPLWIVSLWPGIVAWQTCRVIAKKAKDPIVMNALLLTIGGMILMPLLTVATTVILWIKLKWWIAMAWMLILPVLTRFAWQYHQWMLAIIDSIRVCRYRGKAEYDEMMALRNRIKLIIEKL